MKLIALICLSILIPVCSILPCLEVFSLKKKAQHFMSLSSCANLQMLKITLNPFLSFWICISVLKEKPKKAKADLV